MRLLAVRLRLLCCLPHFTFALTPVLQLKKAPIYQQSTWDDAMATLSDRRYVVIKNWLPADQIDELQADALAVDAFGGGSDCYIGDSAFGAAVCLGSG